MHAAAAAAVVVDDDEDGAAAADSRCWVGRGRSAAAWEGADRLGQRRTTPLPSLQPERTEAATPRCDPVKVAVVVEAAA